ncbi:MAG: type II secretion system protein [Gammaproteobacteria bacterium]|nr:MAG: type II secretion system protein [Gammaproteobacteria bacterium]
MLRSLSSQYSERGFTLIEVIAVIVVLSILAALGGKFVVESTSSYQSTQARSRLINTGRQAIERVSRQLRIALPYSARITNVGADTSCLEFMPIAAGGNYLGYLSNGYYTGYVPDSLNGANAISTIAVAPHTIDFGSAQFVSIGAATDTELYGTNPVSRATLSSRTNVLLILSAVKSWRRNSLSQRFYLLDSPQAFCVVANQLRFYANQDASSANVDLTSPFSLMADNVTASTPFVLAAGSENRNIVVQINIAFSYTLTGKTESVPFNHSVMIRNVP